MDILESIFAKALKLESPWEITKIEFNESEGKIKVFIDFQMGSFFQCPKCKREVKLYDTTEKQWRHINFFQYEKNKKGQPLTWDNEKNKKGQPLTWDKDD
jgi:transposase